jgi:phosphoglucosamine mutase
MARRDQIARQDSLGRDALARATTVTAGDPAAGTGAQVGTISSDRAGLHAYLDRLVSVVPEAAAFRGRVVIDCANGSASVVAPAVFERLGIEHTVLSAAPDGININADCGSTHLAKLQHEVARSGAALGIAFDGDADRMLAVDHRGEVIDGDQLIAMFATDLHERGELAGDHVVVTVLSNLGLRLALNQRGVSLVETPVGDRHVADALETGGYVLGGEQSGHLIFRQHASTGDGVLTSLKLLELLARASTTLADLADASMQRLPQMMINVPVSDRNRLQFAAVVWSEVTAVEAELGTTGRVVLRPSGTEPAIRVMVEAPTIEEVERHVQHLAAVVRRELG